MKVKMLASLFFFLIITGAVIAQGQALTSWVGIRVLDQKDNSVADMKSEMFTLQVNKTPQPIARLLPSGQRQFVIFIDLAFSSPEAVTAARSAVWNFLSALNKTDVAAIAVYDPDDFVRLQCSFTSDRNQWAYALNHLDRTPESEDAAGFYFLADAKQSFIETIADSSAVQADLLKVVGTIPKDKDKINKAADQFSSKITEFAKSLNVVRGEKQVLFFSPGIPSRKAAAGGEFDEEDRDLVMVVPDSTGEVRELPESGGRGSSSTPAVQFLAENFAAANCVVYTFDISTFGHPVSTGKDFLKTLAKETAGAYFADVKAGLEEIGSRPANSYLVGWQAKVGLPQYQDIKITSGENLKIVAPSKLLSPKTILQFNSIEKKLYFSHWIYTDAPYNTMEHRHLIDSFPLEQKLVKTVLFLQFPGNQFLEHKSKARSLYVAGYLMQSDGHLVDYVFTPIRIDTDKTADALRQAGIKYYDALLSAPGEYQFRGVIVDIERNEANTLNIPLTVPDFQGLTVTSPIVISVSPDWIVLRHEYKEEIKRGVSVRYPYEGEKGIFFPDVDPHLQNGSAYFLAYSVYNLTVDSQKRPAPQFRFTLQADQGQAKPVGEIVLAERKSLSDTSYSLMFQFKQSGVSPGGYQLVSEVTDTLAKAKTAGRVNVQVQ